MWLPDGKDVQVYLWRLPWNTGDIEMIYVPPGDFIMGTDEADMGHDHKWGPRHTHAMPYGYWIGRTDVTWRQYLAFCAATGHAEPSAPDWGRKDDHPVVNVTWEDANAYCDWAGLRLPTEAEWEKAARGADGRKYPWGNEWDGSKCNHGRASGGDASDGFEYTSPVGAFPNGASPYGALDMAGNVYQFCDGWYEPTLSRVCRGGSWIHRDHYCRSFFRTGPGHRFTADLGFRVVVRPPPPDGLASIESRTATETK